MDTNKEDALRAKGIAERRFTKRDFVGAKKYAAKAQKLYPKLKGISQMLTTFDVHLVSTKVDIHGEVDFYAVLGLTPLADDSMVKKQFKKLALILHPDKNKTVGADGAFKLVSEAWALLSDSNKRASYDLRRSEATVTSFFHPAYYAVQTPVFQGLNHYSSSLNSHNIAKSTTFWTVCNSCSVQYEYLRKYVNNRLTCKNCRKTFLAIETEPCLNGSVQFVYTEYGHGNQVTYIPTDSFVLTGAGAGFHSGLTTGNQTFQWNSFTETSGEVVGGQASVITSGILHKPKQKRRVTGEKAATNGKNLTVKKNVAVASIPKPERPEKKRKVDGKYTGRNANVEIGSEPTNPDVRLVSGHGKAECSAKARKTNAAPARHSTTAPAFDARQLLIDKASKAIREKLEQMKLADAGEKTKALQVVGKSEELITTTELVTTMTDLGVSIDQSAIPGTISIVVPDPDFHDFDMERSEGCFKPKQIWALYDEEDGMPRLYCLIRQVISLKPFKIRVSYLNLQSEAEHGQGVKACGFFKAGNSDVIGTVNIFSHVICGEKTGKGGVIQIVPKRGEIWAVYLNWSSDRNNITTEKTTNKYEMVEVLDDYTEDLGVCVNPLVKLGGFRTVYQRRTDKDIIRWIPSKEILQFSHQVPSWLIEGKANLPDECCDLDPAAIPEELLQTIS
ncbi:hypothetical protein C5167_039025 [Papaver somniferum]|uniref:J domain-containing protein n=1 Tax=Papaver somniferum TaxID=3469 RepID=A0A4Y7IDH4_PAPSO|nr:uncharacterized protein LOC113302422 [Papaver somniferum]XP_026407118.1 uncharacterized protein LOC113302422 [Papaver somniferum]RZC46086.1 hypothetical protein C5167_039025 [Papaver somniferum]